MHPGSRRILLRKIRSFCSKGEKNEEALGSSAQSALRHRASGGWGDGLPRLPVPTTL